MTAQIIYLPQTPDARLAPRPTPDNTLRADCERLMRAVTRDGRTTEADMRALADFLNHVILNPERDQ